MKDETKESKAVTAAKSPRRTRMEMEFMGKMRPLLFDFTFFDFLTEGNLTIDDIDSLSTTKPWKFLPTLAFAALRSGAEFENAKDKDKLDYNQVAIWINNMQDPALAHTIAECYRAALGFIYHANFGRDVLAELEAKQRALLLENAEASQSTGTSI